MLRGFAKNDEVCDGSVKFSFEVESRVNQPLLFPCPREFRWTGSGGASFDAAPRISVEASLPAQGFAIRASADGVEISHADAPGLRYALAVLEQLRAHHGELDAFELRDWPDFPVRGYMLDISRDRVPTRETLERTVGLLELFRINHFELYTEHTYAFRDHEEVWRDASPMTPEDLQWLDKLCADRDIELVANQNTFGHMARWLKHEAYVGRAETPDGWQTRAGVFLNPAVLAPTEDNAKFAIDLAREVMQNFRSRTLNIGCDETFELGKGRSREEVESRGAGVVYLEHLKRLIEGAQAEGFDVLFWGDILRQHPELVEELPKQGATALAWWYEAPMDSPYIPEEVKEIASEFGFSENAQRGFAGHVPGFVAAGFPFWVCPGTSTWNTFIGRWSNARANLLDAAEVGAEQGACGYLITDWGDNGHMQPPSVSWLPLAYGAAVSWCHRANRDVDLAAALDAFVFEDSAEQVGALLIEIGDAYLGTGMSAFNGSALFTAIVGDSLLGAVGDPDAESLSATIGRFEAAEEVLARAELGCSDGPVVQRELAQAIRLARHGAYRLLRAAGEDRPTDEELRLDLSDAIAEQAACWRMRSREGGLVDSLARLEAALEKYEPEA